MAEALPGTACAHTSRRTNPRRWLPARRRQATPGSPAQRCARWRAWSAPGLGEDLLLANEVADATRLGALARTGARITVAVDSEATIDAAARAGVPEVLIDVNVGLPRCGCRPDEAGRLAERARAAGLAVRGVMGYEGHIVGLEDRAARSAMLEDSMAQLILAADEVGGEVISAGGTGTYDLNTWATEIQAGSYALDGHGLRQARPALRAGALGPGDRDLRLGGLGRRRLRAQGTRDGPRQPVRRRGGGVVLLGRAPDVRPGLTAPGRGPHWVLPAHVDPTVAYHDPSSSLKATRWSTMGHRSPGLVKSLTVRREGNRKGCRRPVRVFPGKGGRHGRHHVHDRGRRRRAATGPVAR